MGDSAGRGNCVRDTMMNKKQLLGSTVGRHLSEDMEAISSDFRKAFEGCITRVKKPNVLVAGVTGAGKSSLINAIFGDDIVSVGHSTPLTQTFTRIEPPNKPIIIYDSRGLEDGFHAEFIHEHNEFFRKSRASPQLEDHIHLVWYVINCAGGRLLPFEVELVSQVFAPTPVLFLLNKADIAAPDQIYQLEQLIASHALENCHGVFRIVADRQNLTQNWCTLCHSDDVTFRKKTNQLYCEECEHECTMSRHLNLDRVIACTTHLLPELAKEAFLFSQIECLQERDRHAKELVFQCATSINMDVSGEALEEVGQMVAKIFILWGWNYLGTSVSESLVREMKEDFRGQDLTVRLVMVATDTILRRKLSRSVIACLGVLVNRPLRDLSEQLLSMVEEDLPHSPSVESSELSQERTEQFTERFMKVALESGIYAALDRYWYTR